VNAMKRIAWIALLSFSMLTPCHAQGPAGKLEDPFLENLAGQWEITRKVRSTTAHNTLEAEWVLQRRFLQLHMRDVTEPPKYEAIVLIGYDRGWRMLLESEGKDGKRSFFAEDTIRRK
jgi:hypothetical protein